jgi:hypothetical protein
MRAVVNLGFGHLNVPSHGQRQRRTLGRRLGSSYRRSRPSPSPRRARRPRTPRGARCVHPGQPRDAHARHLTAGTHTDEVSSGLAAGALCCSRLRTQSTSTVVSGVPGVRVAPSTPRPPAPRLSTHVPSNACTIRTWSRLRCHQRSDGEVDNAEDGVTGRS